MSAEENIALMKRWYREVWSERNNNTVHELLASNARLRGQTGPEEEIQGPDGFVEFAERIRNTFPDTEVAIEDIFAIADKVAVRWVASATHTGNGLGVAPSGRRIRISGMTIARIVNRKIVEGWDNWDRLGMLEQIGAYKPPVILATSA
jgi:steroid delta-isomerase-like uncharacterized protein